MRSNVCQKWQPLLLKCKIQCFFPPFHSAWLSSPLWKAEINPSSAIKALAKYYFVGLNDRLQCVHNDPVLVISSDLGRKSEPAICSPIRSEKFLLFLSTTADCQQRCCLRGNPGVSADTRTSEPWLWGTMSIQHLYNAKIATFIFRGRPERKNQPVTPGWGVTCQGHMFMPVTSELCILKSG